ncbi:MAG: glycosyl hydrolase family 5, partial [Acidobacteria bacterium]|nr:glycosyl hydrolase family 5 [Acidobacteriota bacterium]
MTCLSRAPLINRFILPVLIIPIAAAACAAQTIDVDITPSHETNRFVPNQTLGAGIDRISTEAIDKDLVPATLQRVFAAGWQPVTFRQNTELAVQAWHWNPNGTWSDASGKGYFTGSSEPKEA